MEQQLPIYWSQLLFCLEEKTYKSISNFAEFLNLQFVSSSHFYCIQKNLLFPAIQNAWNTSESDIFQQLKQVQHINICGDWRCDSPGHLAKYGTYSLLDETSGKVVEFSVVQVTEVTLSNAMEYEGCKRSLNSPWKITFQSDALPLTGILQSLQEWEVINPRSNTNMMFGICPSGLQKSCSRKQRWKHVRSWCHGFRRYLITCGGVLQPVMGIRKCFGKSGSPFFVTL